MIIRAKLINFFRIIVSAIFIVAALWINFAPINPGSFLENTRRFLYNLEHIRYDQKVGTWLDRVKLDTGPIVIVDISNYSSRQKNPKLWGYDLIANLISKLRDEGATVIASNLIFSEQERNVVTLIQDKFKQEKLINSSINANFNKLKPEFDTNAHLIKQVENTSDIVLSFLLNFVGYKQGVLPKPIFYLEDYTDKLPVIGTVGYMTNFAKLQQVSTRNGFLTIFTDYDGNIRSVPLLLRYNNKVYPSLALAVAEALYPERKIELVTGKFGEFEYTRFIKFGKQKIKTGADSKIWVPSHMKNIMFKTVSARDILDNKFESNLFKNKIVFIGATGFGLVSFDRVFSNFVLPNIYVQAVVLSCILKGAFLYTPYWGKLAAAVIILLIGFIFSFLLPKLRTGSSILFALLLEIIVVASNMVLFFRTGIVLPYIPPVILGLILILSNAIFGFLFETQKKRSLRKSFAQYVPPEYLNLLLENPDAYGLEGKSAKLTVLFADIHNFTGISENLDASGVKKLLNQFLTPMTSLILQHGGTIDKYVGDMIMAFWGAPIENANHAEAAIETALEMLDKTEALKRLFRAQKLPEVDLGIALNSGLMNVGDMGSEFRRSYTVIGDAVNLGSRLQSATSYYGLKLLVGPNTIVGQTKFVIRLIDKVILKGKKEIVEVYEVICKKSKANPKLMQEIEIHKKALDAYFARDWKLAESLFQALILSNPTSTLYNIFMSRVKKFQKKEPPLDWNGAYEFKEK